MRQKLNECASAQQVTALTTQVQELTTAMTALLKLKLPHSVEKDSNQRTDMSDQQDRHERMDIPFQDYGDKQKVKRSLTQVSTDGSQVMPASTQPHELPQTESNTGMIESTETTPINTSASLPSPEKKKTRIYTHPEDANDNAQEPSAQYTSECTPDDLEL
jgi:hypothetical protein